MTHSMTVIHYAAKFIELSCIAHNFVSSQMVKMWRFKEGLPFYIRN